MAAQLTRQALATPSPEHASNHPPGRSPRSPLLIAWGVSFAAAALWAALLFLSIRLSFWTTPDPDRVESARLAALAPGQNLDPDAVARGERLFARSCALCHGSDSAGVAGRGPDLTHAAPASSDSQLAALLTVKHPASPAPSQLEFAGPDAVAVAAYVQSIRSPNRVSHDKLVLARLALQDAEREAARAAKRAERAAAKEQIKSVPAPGGVAAAAPEEELDPDSIAEGATLFASTCATCHGKDAKGLPSLGKDLTASQFIARLSDEGLVTFIKRGRDPGDPANTTKIAMPPKGGNPAISDDSLDSIVTYLRSLQRAAKAGH